MSSELQESQELKEENNDDLRDDLN